jgi:signal peptidase II
VIDFISVGNFPVFNVADSSVTIGVCLMLLASLLDNRKTKQQKAESLSPEENQSIEK